MLTENWDWLTSDVNYRPHIANRGGVLEVLSIVHIFVTLEIGQPSFHLSVIFGSLKTGSQTFRPVIDALNSNLKFNIAK